MFGFTCPVCGSPLFSDGKTLCCPKQHSYDVARGGYVNLLMSNSPAAKRHGDDTLMIRARTAFLDKGYYRPLLDGICAAVGGTAKQSMAVLDAGCGDGWYTAQIQSYLEENGVSADVLGVDISRDALKTAARRCGGAGLAVASVYKIPVADRSCDLVLSIFAPLASAEFARVLKNDGRLLRVVPLEEHLFELKKAVYDLPRLNPHDTETPEGFGLERADEIKYKFTLDSNADIMNLFAMTPYYYKTGEKDQKKLESFDRLTVTAAFGVRVWKKL